MKLILLILLFFFAVPAFSDGTKILSCPKQINCTGKSLNSCHLSDNIDNVWRISGQGGNVLPGLYKFHMASHVTIASNPEWCHYQLDNTHYATITVSTNFSIFKPKLVNSLWKNSTSGPDFGLDCLYNSNLCLWEEEPGIIIQYQVGDPNLVFFYVDNESGNYKYTKKLLYKDLHNICGATSDCILPLSIQIQGTPNFDYYGIVNTDISNPNKVIIKSIEPASDRSDCNVSKHKFFNALYCKP